MNPLLEARQRRGLSQQDLAEITGYSRQMIQRYEAGRSNTAPIELCVFYDMADSVFVGTYAQRYTEYIANRRAQLPVAALRSIAYNQPIPKIAIHKMREAIEDYSVIRPESGNKASMSDSYFLSATLHIHPYSIQKWQQSGNLPSVIIDILSYKTGTDEAVSNHGEVAQED